VTTSLADDYFDPKMVNRSRLLWTVATRRQLERWEPFVASHVYARFGRRHVRDADVWLAELEHHFALVAARNLIHALELEPPSTVALDPTIRAELIEGRDLLEHLGRQPAGVQREPASEAAAAPLGP